MILLSFNVALGGLEVTPYKFVRETEERLVLSMGQPKLQIGGRHGENTRRRWLSALSLIVVSSAAIVVGANNGSLYSEEMLTKSGSWGSCRISTCLRPRMAGGGMI